LSSRQVADDVPHKRQDLENAGDDGEHGGSESESEVNRQEERRKIDGSEGKSLAREQMLHVGHEAPQEGK